MSGGSTLGINRSLSSAKCMAPRQPSERLQNLAALAHMSMRHQQRASPRVNPRQLQVAQRPVTSHGPIVTARSDRQGTNRPSSERLAQPGNLSADRNEFAVPRTEAYSARCVPRGCTPGTCILRMTTTRLSRFDLSEPHLPEKTM